MKRALFGLVLVSGSPLVGATDLNKASSYCISEGNALAGGLRSVSNVCAYKINFAFCWTGGQDHLFACEEQNFGSDEIAGNSRPLAIAGPGSNSGYARLIVVGCRNDSIPENKRYSGQLVSYSCSGEEHETDRKQDTTLESSAEVISKSSHSNPQSALHNDDHSKSSRRAKREAEAEAEAASARREAEPESESERRRTDMLLRLQSSDALKEKLQRGGKKIAGPTHVQCQKYFADGPEDGDPFDLYVSLSVDPEKALVFNIVERNDYNLVWQHTQIEGTNITRTSASNWGIAKGSYRYEIEQKDRVIYSFTKWWIKDEPAFKRVICEKD